MRGFRETLPSALAVLLALTQCTAGGSRPDIPHEDVRIQLMTSLPLVWSEGASMEAILSGQAEPAPIYRYWQDHYDVTAVDSLEQLSRDDPDIVILAQPRAMDPADLADLDGWVRAGGAVIILTDPDLLWPSALPLADPRRPLVSGLLSPLLGHWGLELVADADNSATVVTLRLGEHAFATRGIGALEPISPDSVPGARCEMAEGGILARCAIGKGRATIVADADFLDAGLWPEDARRFPQKSDAVRFLDSLVQEQIQPGKGDR